MRRGPLEPTDHHHPQTAVPGQQPRYAGPPALLARAACGPPSGSERGEGLVQLRLPHGVLGVGLDCEATVTREQLQGGTPTRVIATQQQLDGPSYKTEVRVRAR